VGVFPKPENCVFVPVPVELRFHDAERSGRQYRFHEKKLIEPSLLCIVVDLLANTSNSSTSTTPQPIADLEIIERAILSVSDMLDRVLTYVRAVLSGEKKGDPAIGRYLMDTLGASTDDLEKGGFNASLQVSLMRCAVHNFGLISPFLVGAGYVDDFLSCKPCTIASGSVITVGPHHCIIGAMVVWYSRTL